MIRSFAALFCFLGLAVAVQAQEISIDPKAPVYQNGRFGFSLTWLPGNYTVVEADNGDGITVTDGKGLLMQAYGALDPRAGDVSRERFFAQAAKHPKAAYTRVNRQQGWYVLSYVENGTIFYTKQFYHHDHWPTLHFEYPEAKKQVYAPLVKNAVSTFKPF